MRYFKILNLASWALITSLAGFTLPEPEQTQSTSNAEDINYCPRVESLGEVIKIEAPSEEEKKEEFVDKSRNIKDLGTDIVVGNFFTTKETLFNFMELVYKDIDEALDKYKSDHDLSKDSIFLLFKGGNVLRMMFNGVLAMLPPEARELMKSTYAKDFKRSDADFSVYIDEKELGSLDYDKVFAEVSDLVFKRLSFIREKFKKDPEKYFDFFRLKKDYIRKNLAKYLDEANEIPAIEDPSNDEWYKSRFQQIQLLDNTARETPNCPYVGELDYQYIKNDEGEIKGTPISTKPDWIVNSDNRTLEWPWGTDENKLASFTLVRSKVAFLYSFLDKLGKLFRKDIGAELIDVSIIHRRDAALRGFLDDLKGSVADWTIDNLKLKAYSLLKLADDLHSILFERTNRPWNGGPKYGKRINRLFVVGLVQILGTKGSGSPEAKDYFEDIKNNIIEPLTSIFPIEEKSATKAEEVVKNAQKLVENYKEFSILNNMWISLAELASARVIKTPIEGDEEGFDGLLEIISNNIKVADELNQMPVIKIDLDKIYKSSMDMLL